MASESTRWVTLLGAAAAGLLAGCTPDLGQPEGALGLLAERCATRDAERVFGALDERARFAFDGIVKARRKARTLIESSYPAEARAEALAHLGDAGEVETGAELFARRCDAGCVAQLCAGVAAPASVQLDGGLAHVRTVRNTELLLYRAGKHYGLVFAMDDLVRERRRAYAELSSVEANAKVYGKQKALR